MRAMSDMIECDGCGRCFVTYDASGMLAAIKGPCPSCGGTFRLAATAGSASADAATAPRRLG
jgi:rRNA maturation endonuclease Nob1